MQLVAALILLLSTASSVGAQAGPKCKAHYLGPGRDRIAMATWLFSVTNNGSTPVAFNCRPRRPGMRAADGTPGKASCALLRRSKSVHPGEATLFVGDPYFAYFIELAAPDSETTIEVCLHD